MHYFQPGYTLLRLLEQYYLALVYALTFPFPSLLKRAGLAGPPGIEPGTFPKQQISVAFTG